jgi:hypothetical protein
MFHRFFILPYFLLLGLGIACLPVGAQDATALFRQAAPEVEESLRKTVDAFVELQLAKKWGASMKFIDEDSMDAYIGSEKDSCFGMEVLNVTYNDDFTDATVGLVCERAIATPVGGGRMPMPFTTYWKRVDGEWKWYAPKSDRPAEDEMVMTPFGPVPRYSPDQLERGTTERVDKEPVSAKLSMGPSVKQLEGPLKVEPETVLLRADNDSTAVAKIRNSFNGIMRLELKWVRLDGLTATIDKTELQGGEIATITIRFNPPGIAPPPKTHAVWIETNPMRSATPIMIEFRYQEDMEGEQE